MVGVSFVVGSIIVSGEPGSFWNLPSAFIIMGGTVGSVIVAFPPKRLKTLMPVMKKAFKKDNYDIKEDIRTIVSLSEIARRQGFLALEDYIAQTNDEFLKKGLQLIVDGAEEEQLRDSLEGATYFMRQRHNKGANMLGMIAATAPALGLLGTYIGLIPMLNNLDDPTKLGPMMALELVSSFYGAFIAYVVFSPLSKRLKFMSEEEETRRELLIEGLAAIQQGQNPKFVREKLATYMNVDLNEKTEINEKDKQARWLSQQ
jgi:chemotaxis protein MotA